MTVERSTYIFLEDDSPAFPFGCDSSGRWLVSILGRLQSGTFSDRSHEMTSNSGASAPISLPFMIPVAIIVAIFPVAIVEQAVRGTIVAQNVSLRILLPY